MNQQSIILFENLEKGLEELQYISEIFEYITSNPVIFTHLFLEEFSSSKQKKIKIDEKKLKEKINKSIDKSVDLIWEKLVESAQTDKIRIQGYGILTKQKLKEILTDPKEAEKFLSVLGFRESGEKAKELAHRIVEGKLSLKDGIKLMVDDIVNWWEKIKNKETAFNTILNLGVRLLIVHFLILGVIEINTIAGESINHLLKMLAIPPDSIVYFGLKAIPVVIIAPILEEIYKLISARLNMGAVGILELPVREFFHYFLMMGLMGVHPLIAFLVRLLALVFHIITIIRYHNWRVYVDIRNMKYANRIIITNLLAHVISNLYDMFLEHLFTSYARAIDALSFTKQVILTLVASVSDFVVQTLGFAADRIYTLIKPLKNYLLKTVERAVKLVQLKEKSSPSISS